MSESYHVDSREKPFQAGEMCKSMEVGLPWCSWGIAAQYAQSILCLGGDVGDVWETEWPG